jgi:hypothetical protein
MSEMGGSYDPGPWRGWDFNSARKAHTNLRPSAGRGYSGSSSTPSVAPTNLVPDKVITNAKSPLVVIVDGTGSMGQFPKIIFQKLPLLDDGVDDYLDDCEISYCCIGDAGSDKYPLQVQPFGKGKQMVETLNKLIIEGRGGSNKQESYDLAALYYAKNAEMPKANKPIMVWVCDEGIYPTVNEGWAKTHAKVEGVKGLTREKLFEELQTKYSVYVIRKHYGGITGDTMTGDNLRINQEWESLVGSDRMAILNDPKRVVDVILGLLAHETGKVDFFKKELEWRQKPDQVKTVYKSMVSVGKKPKKKSSGHSIMKRPETVSKSKSSDSLI